MSSHISATRKNVFGQESKLASHRGERPSRRQSQRSVPLHITISALFLGLMCIAAGGLITYNYHKSHASALLSARQSLAAAVENITLKTELYLTGPSRMAETASDLPEVSEPPTLDTHPASIFMLRMLQEHPQIYSAYMGFEDGKFFQIFLLNGESKIQRSHVKAPHDADIAIRRILTRPDGQRVEIWQYLNADWDVVGSSAKQRTDYKPTERPWYRAGIAAQNSIYTAPYRYATAGTVGFTLARRFESNLPGVFGVDLALSALSGFVVEQSEHIKGQIVIFDEWGRIWAHPDMERLLAVSEGENTDKIFVALPEIGEVKDPVSSALYRSFMAGNLQNVKPLQFEAAGRQYLGEVRHLPDVAGGSLYVLASAPVAVFTAPFDSIRADSLTLSLLFVATLIPLVYFTSRSISRSLRKLAAEANAIREFELEQPLDLKSVISEVDHLNASMAAMKTTIGTFAKFVPRELVRRLIKSGEGIALGGARQDITVMFTDVADFTRITENMPPEDVMRKLSSYMETLTDSVMEARGVIDKFIGDGLMAIWNAPETNPNHIVDACRAALLCRRANDELNRNWKSWGWEVMETRFGLHTGETVVGTMGSTHHMAYTAIGAMVNLASRLEALNKFYGTQILVSENVVESAAGQFLFRFVDFVAPKGITRPVAVYELFGALPSNTDASPGIIADPARIEQVSAWDTAYKAYSERRWHQAYTSFVAFAEIYPDDKVVSIYLDRCRRFLKEPPTADWDGVERYTEK